MMGLSDGRKSFQIRLVVLIQYRLWQTASQPATQPASHVAVAITLNAKASSLKSNQQSWSHITPCNRDTDIILTLQYFVINLWKTQTACLVYVIYLILYHNNVISKVHSAASMTTFSTMIVWNDLSDYNTNQPKVGIMTLCMRSWIGRKFF